MCILVSLANIEFLRLTNLMENKNILQTVNVQSIALALLPKFSKLITFLTIYSILGCDRRTMNCVSMDELQQHFNSMLSLQEELSILVSLSPHVPFDFSFFSFTFP